MDDMQQTAQEAADIARAIQLSKADLLQEELALRQPTRQARSAKVAREDAELSKASLVAASPVEESFHIETESYPVCEDSQMQPWSFEPVWTPFEITLDHFGDPLGSLRSSKD